MNISMEQFFSRCGELMFSTIREEGFAPQRKFTSVFYYQWGTAEFDGRTWKFDVCSE